MVDLLDEKAIVWDDESLGAEFHAEEIPAELVDTTAAAREQLVEAVADFDEDVMARYLEGEAVSADQLRKALREATLGLKVVPVLCGSAFRNKGVQPLLDAVVEYLPSPLDVPPIEGREAQDGRADVVVRARPTTTSPSPPWPSRSMSDKHVGHLTYIRVYSGHAKTGEQVLNTNRGQRERLGRILQMHANKRQEVDEVYAGDIVAVVGLKRIATGETLAAVNAPVILESLEFPDPVISIAIEPQDHGGHGQARPVARAARAVEDPSFRVSVDDETGPDHHLRDGRAPPRDHHRSPAPRVRRRRERRSAPGRLQGDDHRDGHGRGRYIKQTGGSGDYGVVKLEVVPGEPAQWLRVRGRVVKGGVVPKEFVPGVRQGCEEAVAERRARRLPGGRREASA